MIEIINLIEAEYSTEFRCKHLRSELYKGEIWRATTELGEGSMDICDECQDVLIDLKFIYKATESLTRNFFKKIMQGE